MAGRRSAAPLGPVATVMLVQLLDNVLQVFNMSDLPQAILALAFEFLKGCLDFLEIVEEELFERLKLYYVEPFQNLLILTAHKLFEVEILIDISFHEIRGNVKMVIFVGLDGFSTFLEIDDIVGAKKIIVRCGENLQVLDVGLRLDLPVHDHEFSRLRL